MSKYDKTFDKKQMAFYNYNATNQNVENLFNKYRTFKVYVKEFYSSLGSTSREFNEKVFESNLNYDQTTRQVEQLIHLKNFIEYCDLIIDSHIKELNYYEKLIFDEVIVGGKRLLTLESEMRDEKSHGFLSNEKKSCVFKVSMWFDIYVLNDSLFDELKDYKM